MPIDARVEAEKLRTMYKESASQGKINVLLTGESGSGKTFMTRYAPWPIHVDSFDPGGTKSVRDLIEKGNIVADTEFEDEDPMNPTAFKYWKAKFEDRERNGYFDNFACYWLDSATTWSDAVMNYHQAGKGGSGAGKVPVWNKDYHPQKVSIRNYLRKCLNLKCHFILTAHLNIQKDKEGNVIARRVMFSGQGAVTIPLLFDEIWVTDAKESSGGFNYEVKTVAAGLYLARSRLAGTGAINKTEPATLRTILKKAGLNYEDRPGLFGKEEK